MKQLNTKQGELRKHPITREFTLSVIPEPKETSPETFKVSSSTILGIDLNRARKLATYNYRKRKKDKLWPQSSFI
jgi:hypothetical protein